jgi:TolB-like protein
MTTKRLTKATARLAVILAVVTPSTVIADEKWVVLRFSHVGGGATNGLADTFQELLAGEIRRHVTPNADSLTATRCGTIACAAKIGRASGARFALFGSLSKLGSKVIVQSTLVDVEGSAATASQKMSVSRVEELDAAATRIALAYARGTTTDNTAELGLVTSGEMKPDKRREGARGLGLKMGGTVPIADSHGAAGGGLALDVSYWFEASLFAIEPRIGVRFSPNTSGSRFLDLPLEVAAHYIFGRGNFTPFVGFGAGLHFLWESRETTLATGDVIPTTTTKFVEDRAWAFGVSARAGLMLFRTYTMRMAITAEYSLALTTLNGKLNPQALTFGVGVIF